MKREIKFRAWDYHSKEMLLPEWIQTLDLTRGGGWNIYLGSGLKAVMRSPEHYKQFERGVCILMQYTGLKDGGGKEIYEGDLLKWLDQITVVESTDGGWNPFIKDMQTDGAWHYEVIGNIYENPLDPLE